MSHPPPASRGIPPDAPPAAPRFRATLVRVMVVQVVTLLLLWLLQSRYSG